jgi:hypothetical protein
LSLSDVGSIASIIGLFVSMFVAVKVFQLNIKIGKISVDTSTDKQENSSFWSFFTFQKNEKSI